MRGTYIDPHAGRVLLRVYAENWRAAQHHTASTMALYERILRLHVYPSLGDTALASVRRSEMQAWTARLSATLSARTVRQVFFVVAMIFKAALADRLVADSPCKGVTLPKIRKERIEPLTVEQVRSIADSSPDRLRAMVVLAATSGMRSGELLGLRAERIHWLKREIEVVEQLVYIPGTPPSLQPPKTETSRRTIPVPSVALDALAEHLRRYPPGEDGLVFQADKGGPMLRTTHNGRWRRTLRKAGLPEDIHFHHLRHHYASLLIAGGESIKTVQERLGHASASETLDTYAHLWPASDEQTRTILARAWEESATSVDEGFARRDG